MGSNDTVTIPNESLPIESVLSKSNLAPNPTDKPKYTATVKNFAGEEVEVGDPQVTRALIALMDLHAVNGGAACHWGGPSAFAEIMSAIHSIMFESEGPWYESYNFVNDAGHTENGIYALRANLGFDNLSFDDIKKFRSIKSKLTGHGEAHLNPEGILISNGPLGSGLPQAQGLALADKIIGKNRTTICTISDGGSMEGEAKEAFCAIPGLAAKNKMNPFVAIISDNNTKLSGRIDADSFSMEPYFKSIPALGWNVIYVARGNHLQSVYSAIEKGIKEAKAAPSKPVCLIIKTVKGKGVAATEKSASGGHGYPLKKNDTGIVSFIEEIFEGNPPIEFKEWAQSLLISNGNSSASTISEVKKDKIQAGISKGAIKAAQQGYPVFSVSADLQGSTGIAPFHKAYPDRFIEVGVAEANMINTASGLSAAGLIPIADTFAQFGVTKGNLPLTMASLSNSPIIGLFSHTGFQDAADGASHQATTYFAATSSIPKVQVVCCSCAEESESLMYQAIKNIGDERRKGGHPDSVIFFVGREVYPIYYEKDAAYKWGKPQVLREGNDVTIVANGPMVNKAVEAGEQLADQNINATVVNNAFINNPDVEAIGSLVTKTGGNLVTIEDHQILGGMGSLLTHALAQNGVSLKIKSLGIPNHFGQSAYMADHLYEMHGMDTKALVAAVKSLLGR